MNINALDTTSRHAGVPSTSTGHIQRNTDPRATLQDSARFSPEGLAALQQAQGAGDDTTAAPPMTDAMAAKLGEVIRQQSPDLFASLDTDRSGTMTAAKLEAGQDRIDTAIQSGQLQVSQESQGNQPSGPSSTPPKGGGPPGGKGEASSATAATASATASSENATKKQITALHQQGLSNEEIAARLGKTVAQVQAALAAS